MLLELNYYYGNEVEHNGDREYPRLYLVSPFQHPNYHQPVLRKPCPA